jgi:hypothetical protein
MERLTKKEKDYKEVIEQQKEQLSRYEKKFRGRFRFLHHVVFV